MSGPRLFSLFSRHPQQAQGQQDLDAPARELRKREYLRKQDLFRDLDAEDIERIDHQTRMVTCPKRRIVYSQEDRAEALFLLKRGRVQIYRLTPSGKRLDLAAIEPGVRPSCSMPTDA